MEPSCLCVMLVVLECIWSVLHWLAFLKQSQFLLLVSFIASSYGAVFSLVYNWFTTMASLLWFFFYFLSLVLIQRNCWVITCLELLIAGCWMIWLTKWWQLFGSGRNSMDWDFVLLFRVFFPGWIWFGFALDWIGPWLYFF